jgi:hypothetical protein
MNDQELNQLHQPLLLSRLFSFRSFVSLPWYRTGSCQSLTLNGYFGRQCKPIRPAALETKPPRTCSPSSWTK